MFGRSAIATNPPLIDSDSSYDGPTISPNSSNTPSLSTSTWNTIESSPRPDPKSVTCATAHGVTVRNPASCAGAIPTTAGAVPSTSTASLTTRSGFASEYDALTRPPSEASITGRVVADGDRAFVADVSSPTTTVAVNSPEATPVSARARSNPVPSASLVTRTVARSTWSDRYVTENGAADPLSTTLTSVTSPDPADRFATTALVSKTSTSSGPICPLPDASAIGVKAR